MDTLHTGDTITVVHRDPIHGWFEVQAHVVHPVYNADGELERVHVSVGNRSAIVEPFQLVGTPQQ
ncbi:hypothetical protein [Nocardia acidivorans]|uniref:hypothetical protein n=1 Tax=Nocardia acidivorans TaxID=404580 RepID=UPI0008328248|nr:hypothetical protein [Nocardia acidivorans]